MDKRGFNILVIGGMGQGKSTFVKQALKKAEQHPVKVHIWDINQEYTRNDYPGQCLIGQDQNFLTYINTKRQAINVFEEATSFLPHNKPRPEVVNVMSRKRHLALINYFLFTSLAAVPVYCLRMIDEIILFNTADVAHNVKRFEPEPAIWQAYQKSRKLRPLQYIRFKPNQVLRF